MPSILTILFVLTTIIPLPFWFLFIFAPRAGFTRRLADNYMVFILLGVLYIFLLMGSTVATVSALSQGGIILTPAPTASVAPTTSATGTASASPTEIVTSGAATSVSTVESAATSDATTALASTAQATTAATAISTSATSAATAAVSAGSAVISEATPTPTAATVAATPSAPAGPTPISFGDLLANPFIAALAVVVWLHLVTMDLIGGHWIYHEAIRQNAPVLVSSFCLFLALLFGPLGMLMFVLWRSLTIARRDAVDRARVEPVTRDHPSVE